MAKTKIDPDKVIGRVGDFYCRDKGIGIVPWILVSCIVEALVEAINNMEDEDV